MKVYAPNGIIKKKDINSIFQTIFYFIISLLITNSIIQVFEIEMKYNICNFTFNLHYNYIIWIENDGSFSCYDINKKNKITENDNLFKGEIIKKTMKKQFEISNV